MTVPVGCFQYTWSYFQGIATLLFFRWPYVHANNARNKCLFLKYNWHVLNLTMGNGAGNKMICQVHTLESLLFPAYTHISKFSTYSYFFCMMILTISQMRWCIRRIKNRHTPDLDIIYFISNEIMLFSPYWFWVYFSGPLHSRLEHRSSISLRFHPTLFLF